MKIYAFSGTGNSLWTARQMAEALGGSVESILSHRGNAPINADADVLGIVCPVYLDDIPFPVKDFLLRLAVKADPYVFAVLTSNHGRNRKGFASIDTALRHKGAGLSLAADLQMPGNYLTSTAEQDRERLTKAPGRVQQICASVQAREINYSAPAKKLPRNYVKKPLIHSLMARMTVTDACTGCGVCARLCPTGNIAVNGKAERGGDCITCFACIHWCPAFAIKKKSPGDFRQYTHPDMTRDDLMAHLRGGVG